MLMFIFKGLVINNVLFRRIFYTFHYFQIMMNHSVTRTLKILMKKL